MQYVAASGASYVAQRRTLGSSDAAARLEMLNSRDSNP